MKRHFPFRRGLQRCMTGFTAGQGHGLFRYFINLPITIL